VDSSDTHRGGHPLEDKMKFINFDKIRKDIERQEEIIRLKKEIIESKSREIEARLSIIEKMLEFCKQVKRNTP
jgi:hypothetical protein